MASIGDVFLRLVLDDKDFENQVVKGATKAGDKAGKSMSAALGGALTDFGNSAMKVGKSMTRVGDSMTRNVTLPILAAGGATAKLALDFDTTMNQIVGLAKVPREQIQGVRDDILKMAGEIGRSPQELAEAFYFVASAGFKADEAMEVLRISAKAAAAGMGETQDIAKVLGGVLNAYGHENITAARAGDVLTAAIQDGAAEAAGFAGAIGQVVPTAAALGVSFDQVTAAMAAMTNVGIDVDTAATNLNQIFSSLLKPTKEASDALDDVGLSAAGLRQELKENGLLATLRTIQKAFEGNDEALAKVFGNVRALRGVNALLALDEKQLAGIFNDTAVATNNLGQAYDDTEGPQREIARSMAQIQATAIEIGEDVLPIVIDVLHQLAGGAKEFSKWWRSLDDDTKHAIVQWAAWLAIAAPVLSILGRITTGVFGLVKAIGFLVTKLPVLSAAIKTTLGPLGLLVGLLEGASVAADATTKGLGVDYVGTLQKAAFATGDAAKAMTELLDAQKASGKGADEFQRKVAEGIEAGLSWAEAIKQAAYELGGLAGAAKQAVDGGISEFDRGAAEMNTSVAGYSQAAKDIVTATGDALEQTSSATTTAITQMTEEQIQAAKDAHKKVLDELKDLFKELSDLLTKSDFEKKWDDFLEGRNQHFTTKQRRLEIEAQLGSKALTTALHSDDPKRRQEAQEEVEFLIGQYELLAPGALAAGKLVNPAFGKGINSNVEDAYKLAEKIAQQMGLSMDAPDEWEAAGLLNMYAFVQAVDAQKADARKTASDVAKDAARAMAEKDDFHRSGFTAGGGFNEGVEAQGPYATTAGGKLNTAAKDGADASLYPSGSAVGASWIDGLIDAIRRGGSGVGSAARDATSDLRGKSPPKTGPLKEIDVWGFNVASAWIGAFLQAIRGMDLNGTLGGMRGALAGGFASPSLSSLPVPSAALAAGQAAGGSGAGNSFTTQYILSVEGKPKVVGNREDVIDAWQQLGGFGSV